MANIYIQTSTGLKKLSGDVSKESVEKALGYEAANAEAIRNIEDDGSGELTIIDPSGNIIFKVDNEGVHTTDTNLSGISVKESLEMLLNSSIEDDGSGELIISDNEGNAIMRIDKNGIHSTEVELSGVNVKESLDVLLNIHVEDDGSGDLVISDNEGNAIAKVDKGGVHSIEFEAKGVNIGQALIEHVGNEEIHVIQEEKECWNNKSEFSGNYNDLVDKPTISEDEQDNLCINDTDNNTIARFDKSGLTTTRVTSQSISTNSLILNGIDAESEHKELKRVMTEHTDDETIHVTDTDKTNWNNKSEFSGLYNDLEGLPNILDDESSEFSVQDNKGNTVFKIDDAGITTTNIIIDGYDLKETMPVLESNIESLNSSLQENVDAITTQMNSNRAYTELVENNLTSDIAGLENNVKNNYLPKTGGTLTGTLNGKLITGTRLQAGDTSTDGGIEIYNATPFIDFHFGKDSKDYTSRIIESASGVLTVSGNLVVNKQLRRSGVSSSWYNGRDNALICQNTVNGYSPVLSVKTTEGSWEVGTYDTSGAENKLIFNYVNDDNYGAANNIKWGRVTIDEYGTINSTGEIECTSITINKEGGIYIGNCVFVETDLYLDGKDTSLWGGRDTPYRLIRREYVSTSNHAVKVGNTTDDTRLFGKNITLGNDGASVTSDKRLKKDFDVLDKYESMYMSLKPTSFKYKSGTSNRTHIGFIAQEVKDSLEENNLTTNDFAGYVESALDTSTYKEDFGEEPPEDFTTELSLRYDEFVALNTHMIQKLYKENELLKDAVCNLQAEIEKLKETA